MCRQTLFILQTVTILSLVTSAFAFHLFQEKVFESHEKCREVKRSGKKVWECDRDWKECEKICPPRGKCFIKCRKHVSPNKNPAPKSVNSWSQTKTYRSSHLGFYSKTSAN